LFLTVKLDALPATIFTVIGHAAYVVNLTSSIRFPYPAVGDVSLLNKNLVELEFAVNVPSAFLHGSLEETECVSLMVGVTPDPKGVPCSVLVQIFAEGIVGDVGVGPARKRDTWALLLTPLRKWWK
jgi:hypothetical protein